MVKLNILYDSVAMSLEQNRMRAGACLCHTYGRRYKLLEQVGSGASGTVWKCRLADGLPGGGIGNGDDPVPGVVYAAKIIDLRPFKLRERFSMQR